MQMEEGACNIIGLGRSGVQAIIAIGDDVVEPKLSVVGSRRSLNA